MKKGKKQLLVVGDRVLIRTEDGEERTKVGLYLPATAADSQAVQGGTVVATGPGQPLPAVEDHLEEPWKISASKDTRYVPMQARVGDYALFFRKASVEITFENERYLVVPQAAILTLARDEQENDP
jgi:chaperonin GroES